MRSYQRHLNTRGGSRQNACRKKPSAEPVHTVWTSVLSTSISFAQIRCKKRKEKKNQKRLCSGVSNERPVSLRSEQRVSPPGQRGLYLLLWMGGLLTTSPRARIELKMNSATGQCLGHTQWKNIQVQVSSTVRGDSLNAPSPQEANQETHQ